MKGLVSGAILKTIEGELECFELMDSYSQSAVIKVLGVAARRQCRLAHGPGRPRGRGFHLHQHRCAGAQALKVRTALQIGCNITKGLGAGADPEVGRQAAMEDRDRIIELIEGCDMLFITAAWRRTGTGRGSVVAQVAKSWGY